MNLDECFANGLLRAVKPDRENAERSLHLSREYLDDAVKNDEIGCFKVVLILCYTSMFHAARALLFKDGVRERSHACVPIYVKAKYPELERYANMLDSYRELRHGVFYRLSVSIDKKEASEALRSAEDFIARIKKAIVR